MLPWLIGAAVAAAATAILSDDGDDDERNRRNRREAREAANAFKEEQEQQQAAATLNSAKQLAAVFFKTHFGSLPASINHSNNLSTLTREIHAHLNNGNLPTSIIKAHNKAQDDKDTLIAINTLINTLKTRQQAY